MICGMKANKAREDDRKGWRWSAGLHFKSDIWPRLTEAREQTTWINREKDMLEKVIWKLEVEMHVKSFQNIPVTLSSLILKKWCFISGRNIQTEYY